MGFSPKRINYDINVVGDAMSALRFVVSGIRTVGGWYLDMLRDDAMAKVYTFWILLMIFLAIVAPELTPFPYNEYLYTNAGELKRMHPPSSEHLLGTTYDGRDVLSRLLYGARPTVLTGLLGGSIIITIGSTIGITAGYTGGIVDEVLMRATDFVYGVPLIPFGMVMMAMFGMGFFTSIVVIGFILWRSSARVLRSQVLQIKEREYIAATRAMGASRRRIVFRHLLPNVGPMIALLFALGIGFAILVQASLAFIGVVNPFVPSWGVMLRNAYSSGFIGTALWWSIPPGLMIMFTVLSVFMIGRKLGQDDDVMARAG